MLPLPDQDRIDEAVERVKRVNEGVITLRVPQIYNDNGRADWAAFREDLQLILALLRTTHD